VSLTADSRRPEAGLLCQWQDRLQGIYAAMDRGYAQAADHYGFVCRGCADNCCQTRFYHHTLVEWLYLVHGLCGLPPDEQAAIRRRASEVCRRTAALDEQGAPLRVMCPLNEEGLCRLYDHRPMICRLHGLPHEMHPPGGEVSFSPGCHFFSAQCGAKAYFSFDRTPFYVSLARLEQDLRKACGYAPKIKMTVAQMVLESPPCSAGAPGPAASKPQNPGRRGAEKERTS